MEPSAVPDRVGVVRALYAAFGDRDLDAVLAALAPDVDWPNGWEGGRLHGREAVRDYWLRQWAELRPAMTPGRILDRPDGTVEARVRLVVRDPGGALLSRSDVVHVYEFDGELVRQMTTEQAGGTHAAG